MHPAAIFDKGGCVLISRGGDSNGSSLGGEFYASFAELRDLLGPPMKEQTDGYKVSTFKGETFTVYDWKATNSYDIAFRKLRAEYLWHVGSRGDAAEFIEAIKIALCELREKKASSNVHQRRSKIGHGSLR